MSLYVVAIALQLASTCAAVLLARHRRDHLPVAVWSVGTTASSLCRALRAATVAPGRTLASPPYVGVQRVLFHVDQALFMASAAGLAALAVVLCAERRSLALLVGLGWALAVGYLSTHYPEIRHDALRRFYLFIELAALAVAIASIATLWRRRLPMTPARQCLLCCVAVDGGTLFIGAWRWGFWEQWSLNQLAYAMLYAVLTAYQGVLWLRLSHAR